MTIDARPIGAHDLTPGQPCSRGKRRVRGEMITQSEMTVKAMRAALPKIRRCLVCVSVTADDGHNFEVSKAEVANWLKGRDGKEITKTMITDDGRMFIG